MSDLRDDDDTSAGRITQGGSRDRASPGPARRSGRSFWWFAVVLVIAAVVTVAVVSGPHRSAPAGRGTLTSTAASRAATTPGGAPAGPVR